ncbi:MAG: hypothetical protein FWF95_05635 [Syntrophorhabdaceae bacterium]|nr:hypothetical protein [Syntrophorhabdaceae bacterium]
MRFTRYCPSDLFKTAFLPLCAFFSILLTGSDAYAVRPFFTDDARIVDHKACHVENGIQVGRDSTEYRMMPGCNFTGNLELTFGAALSSYDGITRTTDVLLQGKTLFKTLETNGWGGGVSVGNSLDPRIHHTAIGNLYINVPMSFSLFDDRIVTHTNLGWLREKEIGRDRMTWGLGAEVKLIERFWLIAETFGRNYGKPFYHVGFRYALIPGHAEIDTAYGDRFGHNTREQWVVVGLRLVSLPFLP